MEEDYVSESFGLYEDQELIDALGMGRTPGQSLAPLVSPEVADADTVATPVVRGVAGGVRDAVQGFFDFTGEAGEFLQDKMPLGYVIIKDGNLEFSSQRPENMSQIQLPQIESGNTISEGLIRGLSQFVTGMAISPIGKAKEPLQFIKRAAFAESLFDPTEGNLATLLKDLGVDNDFVNLLDSQVDEDADAAERLKARLQQATTGTLEGAVLDGVVAAVRAARSDEGFKQTIKNYFIEAGKAADARLAADKGSTTLSMGVDPTKIVDDIIAPQAKYFEKGNYQPPTAENPVSVVKPTEQEPGIIAFHGSGADFDEFRLEMVGTGEGAQAYGYGLYFTDSEDIAKFYKEAMEQPKYLELEGKPLDSVYTADNEEKFADYVNRNFDPEEHDDVYVVLDNLGQGLL